MFSRQVGLSNIHTFKIAVFNSWFAFFITQQTSCNPFSKTADFVSFFLPPSPHRHSPGVHDYVTGLSIK